MEIKICCVSDTHGLHRKMKHMIPECDILIHAGDYTNRGEKEQVDDFFKWLNEQTQCTNKVIIEGNHDLHTETRFDSETGANKWFEELIDKHNINKPEGSITRLYNSSVQLYGLNIWGSPITPDFYPEHWAHNCARGTKIKAVWDEIPLDTDIVVTHGPVYAKLDWVPYRGGEYVGCAELDYKLQEVKPILHVCGHIHCGAGIEQTIDTIYVNASICNEQYKPVNEPHTIDLTI